MALNRLGGITQGEDIRATGKITLLTCLWRCRQLACLCLDNNGLGDAEITQLLTCLLIHLPLRLLDLSGNALSPRIQEPLSQALREITTLHTLRMADNFLGSEGATKLLQQWPPTCRVHTLVISSNDITDNTVQHIQAWFHRTPAITDVRLQGNRLSMQACRTLEAQRRKRPSGWTAEIQAHYSGQHNEIREVWNSKDLQARYTRTPPPQEALRGRPVGTCLFDSIRHFKMLSEEEEALPNCLSKYWPPISNNGLQYWYSLELPRLQHVQTTFGVSFGDWIGPG